MSELAAILGAVQDGGGLMLVLALLIVEMRSQRKDFETHAHDPKTGKPVIKI